MKNHFDNLLIGIPDLLSRRILDLGSGEGGFLIECARRGCEAVGLELNSGKIKKSYERARKEGLDIIALEGVGEEMPFNAGEFGFVNVGEVIEHVRDPKKVLEEMHRVMISGAVAYISVHNRFGIYDTHFHMYFLGWMPRSWAEKYIKLLKKNKNYESMPDMQRISDMHYYTFKQFERLAQDVGFSVKDTRDEKIKAKLGSVVGAFGAWFYRNFVRMWYFSTFHILLTK